MSTAASLDTAIADVSEFPERLGPVLIKELRQGLRSGLFVLPFVVLPALLALVAVWGLSIDNMSVFVMIFSFSRLNDIKRVFEYHGAEHKTVFAWEAGEELTVANARRHPRQHPRCGTSFLMVVMLVSVALFSLVKFDSLALNLLTRIALIPLIAGVSYEIIRAAGKKESGAIFRLMTLPGVWMQNLTTREPSLRSASA